MAVPLELHASYKHTLTQEIFQHIHWGGICPTTDEKLPHPSMGPVEHCEFMIDLEIHLTYKANVNGSFTYYVINFLAILDNPLPHVIKRNYWLDPFPCAMLSIALSSPTFPKKNLQGSILVIFK